MSIGMLWFDDKSDKKLQVRVANAAKYYQMKYDVFPNLCLVNPNEFDQKALVEGIIIGANRSILPGHLWIGVSDENSNSL